MKTLTCRFGHECTSRCGNDIDCPCQSEHCCALTEDCEGGEHCDDHYEKPYYCRKEHVNGTAGMYHYCDEVIYKKHLPDNLKQNV